MLAAFAAHPRLSVVLLVSAFLVIAGALSWSALKRPPVLASLLEIFENRFPPTAIDPRDEITGIISLGGSLDRVREAVRLASLFPRARVVVTGPGEKEKRLAQAQGFEPERLVFETKAINTFQNGLFTKRLLQPKPGERWLVVTSATHMPRAMGVFSSLDFPVEPWPVFDKTIHSRDLASVIRHEVLGLIAYRLSGYTTAFFPGPLDNIRLTSQTAAPPEAQDIGTAPSA